MSHKSKLKNTQQEITFGLDNIEKYYSFNFKYLVNDKRFGLGYLSKNKHKNDEVTISLFEKFKEIGKFPVSEFTQRPKNSGLEYLPRYKIEKALFTNIDKDVQSTNETKYIVMRFYNQKCRIICKEIDEVLYVLGFDFDFSAYDHN